MVITEFDKIKFPSRIFITGIDTDAGKSYATGWMARGMLNAGIDVTTQKFVQTGNIDFSEDIDVHRKIMGIPYTDEDLNHLTAPEIFTYPASADLAARIDGRRIDIDKISNASDELAKNHDVILIEGAGGLMVPLSGEFLTIDYIHEKELPVVLVTNGRLGSINHTLLSLDAIKSRGLELFAVVYNSFFDKDKVICADTKQYIENYMKRHFPYALYMEMPKL